MTMNLFDFTRLALGEMLAEWGYSRYHADKVWEALHRGQGDLRGLRADLYGRLQAETTWGLPTAVADLASSDDKATILTRSFMVGYLGAGRALLDVAAAALTSLYILPLSPTEATFANGDFWHQLVANAPNVHRRYHPLRLFITEFLRWSFETAHRIVPLGVAQTYFGKFAPREQRLQMLDDGQTTLAQLGELSAHARWVDPLRLHDRWKPQFMTLCEKVCVDLEKHTGLAQT